MRGIVAGVSGINLIVASLDLQLVRLLRQAMRVADLSSGKCCCEERRGCDQFISTRISPTPHIEPRQRITPTARIEPRPVIHPKPAEQIAPQQNFSSPEPVEVVNMHPSPVQPPWRVLPWEVPAPLPPKLKVIVRRPDVPQTGTLFDAIA